MSSNVEESLTESYLWISFTLGLCGSLTITSVPFLGFLCLLHDMLLLNDCQCAVLSGNNTLYSVRDFACSSYFISFHSESLVPKGQRQKDNMGKK